MIGDEVSIPRATHAASLEGPASAIESSTYYISLVVEDWYMAQVRGPVSNLWYIYRTAFLSFSLLSQMSTDSGSPEFA